MSENSAMTEQGPDIRELLRHLAECPEVFLEEPVQPSGAGGVHVDAVLSDLLAELGGQLSAEQASRLRYRDKDSIRGSRNRLRVALLSAWLFSHWGLRTDDAARRVTDWLERSLDGLAALVSADALIHDPDRREEFARLGLAALNMRPFGESPTEAQNRLSALSSIERERVVAEARAAEERARAVREEMLRKQREAAAASVYSNE